MRYVRVIAFSALFLSTLILAAACDDDSSPFDPGDGEVRQVEWAAQMEGTWRNQSVVAGGLPVNAYLVPAFTAGVLDSRLSVFSGDLAVTVTGEKTGVFSLSASATAVDTADAGHTASGMHEVVGGFEVDNGELAVTLLAENDKILDPARTYLGQARMNGDTLLLDFTLQTPPEKDVPFLPDNLRFIARMVRP